MQPGQQVPTFLDPTIGGEIGPSPEELAGRLCAFIPKSYDPSAPNKYYDARNTNSSPTKPMVTADVIVLDGGQFYYGKALKADPPRPAPTHVIAIDPTAAGPDGVARMGAEFINRAFSGPNMVAALRDAIGKGIVLGRVVQGVSKNGNNPPWNIAKLEPNDPGRQLAAQYFGGRAAGSIVPHTPVELTPAPSANMPVNPYGAQPQFVPPAGMTQQGFVAPPAPTPQPPNPALYGNPQAQPAAPQLQYQPPAPQQVEFIPPGFESSWATFTDLQKQQILAQFRPNPMPEAGQQSNAAGYYQ